MKRLTNLGWTSGLVVVLWHIGACLPPDTQVDAGAADGAGVDAGALVSTATVTALGGTSVATASWADPVQQGGGFGSAAFYRLEGNELVAYDIAALGTGAASELARVSVQPADEADPVTGIALAVDDSVVPERIWFTYGKADWTASVGSTTFDGAFAAVDTELSVLFTTSNFPIFLADLGGSLPELHLVAVDDMLGNLLLVDVQDYAPGTALTETTRSVAGCSGQPQYFYLGAAYRVRGSLLAVSYTGGIGSDDEGKGGFFLMQLALAEGSACVAHVALEPGTETDSHVAVGGLAAFDDSLVVLWDHYGGGMPAPRYSSKIVRYPLRLAPTPSVTTPPTAQADLTASWPTGAVGLTGGEVVVMLSPPDGAFQLEVFDAALTSLGTVVSTLDADSYYVPLYGWRPDAADGTFWLGMPEGLVQLARP